MSETVEKTPAVPQLAANGATAKDVRAWANENGFEVGARGRIAAGVVEAFNAAHPA